MSQKSLAKIAQAMRRFVNRRSGTAGDDVARFRQMMQEDAIDALLHSREALVAAARKGIFDECALHFDEAATIFERKLRESIGVERPLTDAEHEEGEVAGFRQMMTRFRAAFYRVARDLAAERDAHRMVVQGARCAALAEVLETADDELLAAGVSL